MFLTPFPDTSSKYRLLESPEYSNSQQSLHKDLADWSNVFIKLTLLILCLEGFYPHLPSSLNVSNPWSCGWVMRHSMGWKCCSQSAIFIDTVTMTIKNIFQKIYGVLWGFSFVVANFCYDLFNSEMTIWHCVNDNAAGVGVWDKEHFFLKFRNNFVCFGFSNTKVRNLQWYVIIPVL